MNPESKVFEKIRKVLIADTTIASYISDRVYTEHISSVESATYPAISLHLMNSRAMPYAPDVVEISIQIDLWLPATTCNTDDVLKLYQRIRELLHKQSLTDATIGDSGVVIGMCVETGVGEIMYDSASACRHLPARYFMVAI